MIRAITLEMDPQPTPPAREAPTHCQYSRCDKGPDGGPAPIAQHPLGKRTRFFCCDAHRAAADQLAKRLSRVTALPAPAMRQVVYGEDVLSVHRDFRASIEGLKTIAEQLSSSLVAAADLKAAKAAVDEGEKRLAASERQTRDKLVAMTEARASALDRAEIAEEAAENERMRAEQAVALQLEAEAQLEEAREEFERERAELREQLTQIEQDAEKAVKAANARAAAAEAAQQQAQTVAQAEISRARSAAETATREARELAARAEGAREASLAEVKLAHEEARRARDEIERVRGQFQQQLEHERDQAQARVEDVRAGLQAQLMAAHQLAEERRLARDQIAQQLAEHVRAEVNRRQRILQRKERPK